ncbi:hypothetical protein SLEP1_g26352 [Rubroshorea leprosula]|uniref:Uncharacterized protein n=1 Tax=Rubroshorea leprosula TaxID=152421 RepID=A0AAV5JT09_9ROSI|nr:hypothetical protein SLEP1_g26352 [Rubroshorea leprosula]
MAGFPFFFFGWLQREEMSRIGKWLAKKEGSRPILLFFFSPAPNKNPAIDTPPTWKKQTVKSLCFCPSFLFKNKI